jgi:hypothetical protein
MLGRKEKPLAPTSVRRTDSYIYTGDQCTILAEGADG